MNKNTRSYVVGPNLIGLFTRRVDDLMLYFPDPKIRNEKFIVEHSNAREKMNDALVLLQKLLKNKLRKAQLIAIKEQWSKLAIMKTVHKHSFDKINQNPQNLFKNNNEMKAYFTLSQFIYEYEFFQKVMNRKLFWFLNKLAR